MKDCCSLSLVRFSGEGREGREVLSAEKVLLVGKNRDLGRWSWSLDRR